MSDWIILIGSRDLVTQSPVKLGRLEAMRAEYHLRAATFSGLALGGGEQARAQILAPLIRTHPQEAHLTALSPGPAIKASQDCAGLVSYEERQQLSVVDTRGLEVIFVDAVFEELYIGWRRAAVDGW